MGTITRAAFITGLDGILLVAAIIAFVAGAVSLAVIRGRDFARTFQMQTQAVRRVLAASRGDHQLGCLQFRIGRAGGPP